MYAKSEEFEDYQPGFAADAAGMAFALASGATKRAPAARHCQLFLPRVGAVRVSVGNVLWFLGAGNALLLGIGVPATVQAVGKCVVHVAHLPPRDSIWRQLAASRVLATELVRALLGELVQAPHGPNSPRMRRIVRLLVEDIQLEQAPPISLPHPSDSRLLRACNAVLDDPSKAWDARTLGRLAGVSTRTLSRQFLQQTGTTPAHWCRAARLTAALTEVARGGSLHAAAAASGFAGPASLCAAFRQTTGATFRSYFRTRPFLAACDEVNFFG